MKIGMSGSKDFQKKREIKELIWKIKNEIEDLEIVSMGQEVGADKFVKTAALDLDIKYSEIIPYYKMWNQFCVDRKKFLFNKKYSTGLYFSAIKKFSDYCDSFVIFSIKGEKDYLKEICRKSEKKVIVMR